MQSALSLYKAFRAPLQFPKVLYIALSFTYSLTHLFNVSNAHLHNPGFTISVVKGSRIVWVGGKNSTQVNYLHVRPCF